MKPRHCRGTSCPGAGRRRPQYLAWTPHRALLPRKTSGVRINSELCGTSDQISISEDFGIEHLILTLSNNMTRKQEEDDDCINTSARKNQPWGFPAEEHYCRFLYFYFILFIYFRNTTPPDSCSRGPRQGSPGPCATTPQIASRSSGPQALG